MKHNKEETKGQEDVNWMHIQNQLLKIINIYWFTYIVNKRFFNENSGQMISLKRYRSLNKQYNSKEWIK